MPSINSITHIQHRGIGFFTNPTNGGQRTVTLLGGIVRKTAQNSKIFQMKNETRQKNEFERHHSPDSSGLRVSVCQF